MSNLPQSVPSEAFKAKKLHQNVRDCFVKKYIRKASRSEKNNSWSGDQKQDDADKRNSRFLGIFCSRQMFGQAAVGLVL